MTAALGEARKNLDNPPRVYTEIAIEQLDGNRGFFETDVPEAFTGVKDAALLAEFKRADDAVMAALDDYKGWLQNDLLPRSNGSFAYGEDTYRKVLAADEMITTPLPDLLSVAEADLKRNQQAFDDAARQIDPTKPPTDVFAEMQKDFPPASQLLAVTQHDLDSPAQFVRDKGIIDVPQAPPAQVKETPPFMRATTSASMDTPGPFEKVATEAYFYTTLPDPSWPKQKQDDFMSQWYKPSISNVSVHEVWPGHYVQFLYAKDYPSDVRKVFGAASNFEGWAHYCEQMMLDEGVARRRSALPAGAGSGCVTPRRPLHRRYQVAHAGYGGRAGTGHVRQGRVSAPAGCGVGGQTRNIRCHIRLLHDGQADDPQAARRLQGEDGRRVLAEGFPRRVHQARTASTAADPQGDARRGRQSVLAATGWN
jgi:hypothetical protein